MGRKQKKRVGLTVLIQDGKAVFKKVQHPVPWTTQKKHTCQ